jgi:hypothetical protein
MDSGALVIKALLTAFSGAASARKMRSARHERATPTHFAEKSNAVRR